MSGNRSTGRRDSEIPPSRMTTPLSIIIMTGRWMANRGMLIPCSGRGSGYRRTRPLIATLAAALAVAAGSASTPAPTTAAAPTALTEEHDPVAFAQRRGSGGNHTHAFVNACRNFNFFRIRHAERDRLEFGHVTLARHIDAFLSLRVTDAVRSHD